MAEQLQSKAHIPTLFHAAKEIEVDPATLSAENPFPFTGIQFTSGPGQRLSIWTHSIPITNLRTTFLIAQNPIHSFLSCTFGPEVLC